MVRGEDDATGVHGGARAWSDQRIDLAQIDAEIAIAVCDGAGEVVGLSPGGRVLLGRLGIELSQPAVQLPAPLWGQVRAAPPGHATVWAPSGEPATRIGVSRYRLGTSHLLLLMREVSEKHRALCQRLHQQRLEVIGRLVSMIVHDLRAPLASLVLNASTARYRDRTDVPTDVAERLHDINAAADRLRETIDQVLHFARLGPPASTRVDLAAILERVSGLLRPVFRDSGSQLHTAIETDALQVQGNPLVVEQILVNLALNAIETEPPARRVRVVATRQAQAVRVTVSDDGPGVPEAVRPHIFEPFFTTKASGTGLGLPTAREAARDLGGDLALDESADGASFSLLLPVAG